MLWKATLISIWVALTGWTLYEYQGKYLVPVSKKGMLKAIPKSDAVHGLVETGHPTLINFWNPDCACSEFAEPEVRRILSENQGKFELVTVVVTDSLTVDEAKAVAKKRNIPGTLVVDTNGDICRKYDVLAAPAAVIYDREGRPVFRGGYNIARFCDSKETAFAEKALVNVIRSEPVRVSSLPFFGCRTFAAR